MKRTERADGDRLNAALQALGLSQNAAARLTGIRQGWLTNIINGSRAIGREDLRRLGTLRISADYLLGLEGAPMFREESRPKAELEADFARFVERQLTQRVPLSEQSTGSTERYRWVANGPAALDISLTALQSAAETELTNQRTNNRILANVRAVVTAINTFAYESIDAGNGDYAALEGLLAMAKRELARAAWPNRGADTAVTALLIQEPTQDPPRNRRRQR